MDNSSRVADELHLALLFTGARTHNGWADRPVEERLLRRLYELARMPPTAANTQPMRLLFVRSGDAKERLRPMLHEANREKTMKAPATAIVAYDTEFYEKMPVLFPARPEWRDTFAGMPEERREKMATHSALLQAGYLVLAARALGLDCGPMGGFDAGEVNAAFFPDGKWKALLLVNLGYGDPEKLFPRNPRLEFDDACVVA